eukprot:17002-Chlamydomonas_euryale.AAC.5
MQQGCLLLYPGCPAVAPRLSGCFTQPTYMPPWPCSPRTGSTGMRVSTAAQPCHHAQHVPTAAQPRLSASMLQSMCMHALSSPGTARSAAPPPRRAASDT